MLYISNYSTGGGTGDMVLASAQTNSGVKTFLDGTLGLRNVLNTITSFFANSATVARTWTFPDKDGTVAMTSDITGTNSGTNTGDVTLAGTLNYITIVGQVITRALIDLTTHVTGILTSVNGGTGNGFTKFTGATTTEKIYTLPDANETFPAHGASGNVMTSNGTIWTSATPSAASGSNTTKSITQTTHGFAVNDVIKFSGTTYSKAQADSAANAEVVGVVTTVTDANNFTFMMEGFATVGTLISDTTYFLSPTTAGLLTATEPTTIGQISKPVLKTTSTTTAIINNMRGMEITNSPTDIVALTVIPQPPVPVTDTANRTVVDNTTMYLGLVTVPLKITVNKLTIRSGSATTPAALNLTVYSEDGQTQLIALTTTTVNTSVLLTTSVSSVTLNPGNYWFAFNGAAGSISVNMQCWSFGATTAFSNTSGILYSVTSEPILMGSITITASTPPTTINPLTITPLTGAVVPVFRLDN